MMTSHEKPNRIANRGAADAANTDAKPLIAHAQGTMAGWLSAVRVKPSGKRWPMAKASGAIVHAAMMQRATTSQDWVSDSQLSSAKRKPIPKIAIAMAAKATVRLALRHDLLHWLPTPAKTRKLAMTTAAA